MSLEDKAELERLYCEKSKQNLFKESMDSVRYHVPGGSNSVRFQ